MRAVAKADLHRHRDWAVFRVRMFAETSSISAVCLMPSRDRHSTASALLLLSLLLGAGTAPLAEQATSQFSDALCTRPRAPEKYQRASRTIRQ
jgi:hypothetical protein